VTINLILILVIALIWLILGIIIALDVHPGLPDLPEMKGILAILSIAIALILAGLTYLLFKHNRTAYYLTLGFFGINCLLTIFDDIGWADVIFLLISLVPILLLIKDRAWYLTLVETESVES
jgi:hypothetical protein